MRLVLFDIDGTLLSCGRQVAEIFLQSLEEAYGRPAHINGYSFAGKTDSQIVRDLMVGAGLESDAVLAGLPRMQQLYLGRLEERLDHRRMRLLPGVREVLERLVQRSDLRLGLLTGNWRRGALAKLSRFRLEHYFPFGAFGDDGTERASLLPVALRRAERDTGLRFDPAQTVIVGDSPLDVACGQAHGVPVIAVATGHTPREALHHAGADWVVENLLAAELCLDAPAA